MLHGGPVLADLDGDGRQEILQATHSAGLYGFDDSGHKLPGFPLLTDGLMDLSPVAADMTGSGRLQLSAVAGNLLYSWNPLAVDDSYTGGLVAWGQAGAGPAGTGALAQQSGPFPPGPDAPLLPGERVYCYPNPVGAAGSAHLRFFLARAARLELRVFDALGERVDEIDVTDGLQAAAENEIVWSTAEYSSGLYLCQLRATAEDGTKAHATVRMAVSR